MQFATKSNLPQNEPLRWNLRKAAVEFGTTVDTLKKSLNQISAVPDSDGLFSTAQLVQGLVWPTACGKSPHPAPDRGSVHA